MNKHEELYRKALAAIPHAIKQEEERERKSDRRYQMVCGALAGANLAAGNIPGWLVCTGLCFIPNIRRWIGK